MKWLATLRQAHRRETFRSEVRSHSGEWPASGSAEEVTPPPTGNPILAYVESFGIALHAVRVDCLCK